MTRTSIRSRIDLWPDGALPAVRAKARRDLLFFCTDVLGYTLLEDEPHGKLCRWLMRPRSPERVGVRRRLLLMPRTTFKTTLGTVAYNLHGICHDPGIRILIDSDLRANSKRVAGVIRSHLESNERLRQLYGNLVSTKGWTEDYFTVPRPIQEKEPTVMTGGMDQVVVMLHFRRIVGDDLVNHTNVNTKEQLEKTYDHIALYAGLTELPEIEPDVEILLTGTRWDDQDAYMRLLRSSGLADAQITKRLDEGECEIGEWEVFFRSSFYQEGRNGARHYFQAAGTPLFSLLTPEFLRSKQEEFGPYRYAANMLNDPVPVAHATFKREWFKPWDPPLPNPMTVAVILDPAISERKHGDYSGLVAMGAATVSTAAGPIQRIYVLDVWHGRVPLDALISKLFEFVTDYRPQWVGLEEVSFQRALRPIIEQESVRRKMWLPLLPMKPDTTITKEMRLRALQAPYAAGMILHSPNCGPLEFELLRFPRGQHDDLIDVVAYGYQLLTSPRTWEGQQENPSLPDNPTTGY